MTLIKQLPVCNYMEVQNPHLGASRVRQRLFGGRSTHLPTAFPSHPMAQPQLPQRLTGRREPAPSVGRA